MNIEKAHTDAAKANKLNHWREVFKRWEDSGLKQRDFCAQKNINYFAFKKWRVKVMQADGLSQSRLNKKTVGTKDIVPIKFSTSAVPEPSESIRITLNNGTQLALPSHLGVDFISDLLTKVNPCSP